jgi:DNA ligase-4
VEEGDAGGVTHVLVPDDTSAGGGADMDMRGMARRVGVGWVEKCWSEGTMVDEERFQWG